MSFGVTTLIFIGRPESNSALSALDGQLGATFDGAAFTVGGKTYASENFGSDPGGRASCDPNKLLSSWPGNSALQTVRMARMRPHEYAWQVYRGTKAVESGF